MEKEFYIRAISKSCIWVVILSTDITSQYWNELQTQLVSKNYPDAEVYFDFLYRNGFKNRFFKTNTNSSSMIASKLSKCEVSEEQSSLTDEFFSGNINLLDGSVLSSLQKNMYIQKLLAIAEKLKTKKEVSKKRTRSSKKVLLTS